MFGSEEDWAGECQFVGTRRFSPSNILHDNELLGSRLQRPARARVTRPRRLHISLPMAERIAYRPGRVPASHTYLRGKSISTNIGILSDPIEQDPFSIW